MAVDASEWTEVIMSELIHRPIGAARGASMLNLPPALRKKKKKDRRTG
jgi:hypothetical protein